MGIITFHHNNSTEQTAHTINRIDSPNDTEIVNIINQYPKVFQGVGKLNNYTAKFYINSDIPPVVSPARPIPFHLQERFNNEIQKMQDNVIIEEHEGPAHGALTLY